MNVAVVTRSSALFNAIKESFDAQGQFNFFQCADQPAVALLNRGELALVIIDSGNDPQLSMSFLSWRVCHCLFNLPCVVIGQAFDSAGMTALFDAGADDIVVGALNLTELYVRSVRALEQFQSVSAAQLDRIEFGRYSLDKQAGTVTRDDISITLTALEFALTWLFFSNPGKVLSRNHIAHVIWGKHIDVVWRTLEQHIYKIRRKVNLNGSSGVRMKTVYSRGYRLEFGESRKQNAPVWPNSDDPRNFIFCLPITAAHTRGVSMSHIQSSS